MVRVPKLVKRNADGQVVQYTTLVVISYLFLCQARVGKSRAAWLRYRPRYCDGRNTAQSR